MRISMQHTSRTVATHTAFGIAAVVGSLLVMISTFMAIIATGQ